jgi:hypothetical protein
MIDRTHRGQHLLADADDAAAALFDVLREAGERREDLCDVRVGEGGDLHVDLARERLLQEVFAVEKDVSRMAAARRRARGPRHVAEALDDRVLAAADPFHPCLLLSILLC